MGFYKQYNRDRGLDYFPTGGSEDTPRFAPACSGGGRTDAGLVSLLGGWARVRVGCMALIGRHTDRTFDIGNKSVWVDMLGWNRI